MRGIPSVSPWVPRAIGTLLCGGALLCASACGVYQAGVKTGAYVNQTLPPNDPAQVKLFGGDDRTIGGEEVGFVVGVSDVDEEWLAMQRLRDAAAKLGADAVVDLRFEVLQSSHVVARGRAIRLAPVPVMPASPAPAPVAPAPPASGGAS